MFPRALGILVVFMMLAVPTTARATVMLTVENGQLRSAWGVEVGDQVLDVEFVDGSCIELFGGCNENSDFFFTDQDSAIAASQALLEQVFIDGEEGFFGSNPETISGCESLIVCGVLSPFDIVGSIGIATLPAIIQPVPFPFIPDSLFVNSGSDFSDDPFNTWAVWSTSPIAVPLPPASMLFLVGLVGLVGVARVSRRRRPVC